MIMEKLIFSPVLKIKDLVVEWLSKSAPYILLYICVCYPAHACMSRGYVISGGGVHIRICCMYML